MNSLYLKGFYRRMLKNKSYFLINVAGLSIAITCFMLIYSWVKYERSYDDFYQNAKNIYRVHPHISVNGNNFTSAMAPPTLAEALKSQLPEVIESTRIWSYDNNTVSNEEGGRKDKVFNEKHLYQADSSFFKIFDFKTLRGDPKKLLTLPFTVAITKQTAIKYFSQREYDQDLILGKSLMLTFGGKGVPYKITGIMEDIPSNAHFHYDIIFSNNFDSWSKSENWIDNTYYTYILLKDGTDASTVESKLPGIIRANLDPQLKANFGIGYDQLKNRGDFWEYKLLPLTDIHLHSDFDRELEPNGDSSSVAILSVVAVLLILIACINYANLATAYSMARSKEIGIRKTLGSSKLSLRLFVFAESAILSLISWILAIGLILVCIHPFENLMGFHIPGGFFAGTKTWSMFVSIYFIVSFSGGIYPAFYLASFNAIKAIKGGINSSRNSIRFKSALVMGQFAISIGLSVCAGLTFQQLHFLREKQPGFNKENIVVMSNPSGKLYPKLSSFLNELKSDRGITSASICSDYPGNGSHNFPIVSNLPQEKEDHLMTNFTVGYDFLQTFGVPIVEGRNFVRNLDKEGAKKVIVNEAAVRDMHLKSPVNTFIAVKYLNALQIEPQTYEIIGVMKDFNFQSLHHLIRPIAIFLGNNDRIVCVRLNPGNPDQTLARIEEKWKSFFPEAPFEFNFVDDKINNLYGAEARLSKLLNILTGLIIFVAAIGLFGITQLVLLRRTREMSIRKVLGASFLDIFYQLSKQYIRWVVISFIIAFPLSLLIMNKWLQNFAYRAGINPWIFVDIAVAAIFMTLLITSYCSIKVALQNPVQTLRTE